ncbi:MAG: hypothetical protein ACT4O1_10210 [Gemmatimonadota bacterium]
MNGTLDRGLFTQFARQADRETPQYSYRKHPAEHRELSDAEIARWDARVDGWARALRRLNSAKPM